MKNKFLFYIISGIVWTSLVVSCKKFSHFQTDPNHPTEASPGLLLTNIEERAFSTITTSAALASRMLCYIQTPSLDQYYGWQRASFDGYNSLRQVMKMKAEATRVEEPNYIALGLFFQSYYIIQLTQTFGDVPYSAAMQAKEGNFKPTYDTQKDIYLKVLNDLKKASTLLSESNGIITGDVIYEGNIQNWKKAINSFTLRILMSLSHKTEDPDLKVIQRFKAIVNNPSTYPIFTSNDDNAALPYYDLENNRYPYYNDNGIKTDFYLDASFVHILQKFKDPRLFVFADKMPSAVDLSAHDFDAYGGLQGSAPLQINTNKVVNGKASQIDSRYFSDPVTEPSIAIGYPEVQFILAEAVARGWINGDAAAYYKNGIRASMEFFNYHNEYSSADIDSYLDQAVIQLKAETELDQILTQKYISFYMQCGWEPFYNQRRTGIPLFETSGDGILNGGKIPKRWMYPESEYIHNKDNVAAAVERQYPNGDNINGLMWLLK